MFKLCIVLLFYFTSCSLDSAVKLWNDTCVHTDECFDDRMTCAPDDYNVLRCLCNRFHKWSDQSRGCVQIYSVAYMMNQTVSVQDNEKKLDKIQDFMFNGPIYSVFFMMFIIGFCVLSIIFYCCYIRRKDAQLKREVNYIMENKRTNIFQAFPTTSSSQC